MSIAFKFRSIGGGYMDTSVSVGGGSFDLGLLGESERESLASDLRAAADELLPIDNEQTEAYAEGRKDEREEWRALSAELESYLEAQDALDNRELNGINAEDYFVLLRRRNYARDSLEAAIASVEGKS